MPLKEIIKFFSKFLKIKFFESFLSYSIIYNEFNTSKNIQILPDNNSLWKYTIDHLGAENKIFFIEFGVYDGTSIKFFSKNNLNKNSKFFGFDSFVGLPEDWTKSHKKGTFDLQGIIPDIKDKRVKFISGWFQNKLPDFLSKQTLSGTVLVHYDADLYSSTLYCLSLMHYKVDSYFAIFDEFTGDESRALYNYMKAFGAKVSFIARTKDKFNHTQQLLCKIEPQKPVEY